jgi:hypothetical protein
MSNAKSKIIQRGGVKRVGPTDGTRIISRSPYLLPSRSNNKIIVRAVTVFCMQCPENVITLCEIQVDPWIESVDGITAGLIDCD